MKTKNTFHVGLVVQNNDPEHRNRCKIFIPSVTSYGTDKWILANKNKDRQIKFDDLFNPNEDLQEILLELKNILPWAEYAGSIFGGNSSYAYNSENKSMELIQRPSDKFTKIGSNRCSLPSNPYAFNYNIKKLSGSPSGLFSIPNVGSCVWCFFHNNNYNSPVYFASAFGDKDMHKIYSSPELSENDRVFVNYPKDFENIEEINGR